MFRVYAHHTPLVGDSKASCWSRSDKEGERHTGVQLSEVEQMRKEHGVYRLHPAFAFQHENQTLDRLRGWARGLFRSANQSLMGHRSR